MLTNPKPLTLRTLCESVRCESVEGVKKAPWAHEDESANARHFYCVLGYKGRILSTDFFQGRAIRHNPASYDVLYCLLADAAGSDDPFSVWASDLGYDADSRSAEKIYKQVRRQTADLRNFLAEDYDTFLYAEQD